jgi:catechol 2,3-dioxygenase-like lactoylglutathione lyase family enzyme
MLRAALLTVTFAAGAYAQPLPLEGIAHVGYRVRDLDKTHAYYTGVLGFERAFQIKSGAVFYKVNDDQFIEIQPGLSAQDDVRLTHIALQTSNLAATRRLLGSRGIRMKGVSVVAPEGTRIDFVEYDKRSPEVRVRRQFLAGPRISDHLQHAGVIVAREEVEPVLRFYRDALGCQEIWRYEPKPGDLRLIKLRLPGERHDIIELMIHSGPLNRDQIGSMHHINFEVADIHAAHRFVRARDASLPGSLRPRVNAEDIWSFNLLDPDRSRIEVQDLTKIPMTSIHEETFHGRRAWVLSNGLMRVSVLAGGGHIAEVRLLSDDPKKSVNPMRVPHYQTIDPHEYDDAKHNAIYGGDPHRWLSSGYMGHLLCFPEYGPPSAEEVQAGLGNHGEAPIVEWRKISVDENPDGITLRYGADLPKTQYRVERAVTLPRGMRVVRVQEWVENLTAFDRPINWMQHATFGPPFAEPGKTMLDASATRGKVVEDASRTGSLQSDSEFQWPHGTAADGSPADLRMFQTKDHSGTYAALRLDPKRAEQFFTLYHPDYRVLIGYTFPSEGNWWLADWQENRHATFMPWDGKVIARGLEFGSSPFAEGLRKSVVRGSLFDTPAYRWIGGKQRLGTEFSIFLEEIPNGFRGVADVRSEGGVPIVTVR